MVSLVPGYNPSLSSESWWCLIVVDSQFPLILHQSLFLLNVQLRETLLSYAILSDFFLNFSFGVHSLHVHTNGNCCSCPDRDPGCNCPMVGIVSSEGYWPLKNCAYELERGGNIIWWCDHEISEDNPVYGILLSKLPIFLESSQTCNINAFYIM